MGLENDSSLQLRAQLLIRIIPFLDDGLVEDNDVLYTRILFGERVTLQILASFQDGTQSTKDDVGMFRHLE
jgi:hypothetical protein